MAKKNENKKVVENIEKQTKQTACDIETQETQAQTDSGKGNETKEKAISTQSTDTGASDKQTASQENTKVDTPAENKGNAGKGNQDGSEVADPVKVSLYKKMREIAQPVFKKTDAKVLYFTKDFIPFFNKNDASKHAAELDSDLVIPVNRLV